MLRIIIQGLLVFVMSLTLGGVGVYLYSAFQTPKQKVLNISLVKKDLSLVDEVFDASGALMDQLAYSFDDKELKNKAVTIINQAGIEAKIYNDRLMVEPGKAGVALDLLSLKGYIPGVENFTFTDITATEGSLEYKLQNRLATQNMLSNMVETMTEGVEEAKVNFKSNTLVGDIDGVKVILLRKSGVSGINLTDLDSIKNNIIAMTGIADRSTIDIIDHTTGVSY